MKTLRQLRDERNLSRRALAIAIDVDPMAIYLWEQKGTRPNEVNLQKLVEYYGVPAEEIDVVPWLTAAGRPRKKEVTNAS